jgi:hypothetical protein
MKRRMGAGSDACKETRQQSFRCSRTELCVNSSDASCNICVLSKKLDGHHLSYGETQANRPTYWHTFFGWPVHKRYPRY